MLPVDNLLRTPLMAGLHRSTGKALLLDFAFLPGLGILMGKLMIQKIHQHTFEQLLYLSSLLTGI
ncbi:MAG: hypothetical protein M2R45_00263 [Verrucomicrobia subdivision 3 bacterium]|nr:hypothetical protein [Limisphaerales bacterium]MCS1412977.1 hypothetical protein [Limisphaerales bacterium]